MVDLLYDCYEPRIDAGNQALQAAMELSMMNMTLTDQQQQHSMVVTNQQQQQEQQPYGIYCGYEGTAPKSSLNVTQCVSVPSSEHVAEIVGKQGCKIKALRAKTNTYIKTPARGEAPIFSISGRPDHVNTAKYEILAAAEHFSQIRASRPSPPTGPGSDKVTIYVRVPYRVVGLVVGPRGSTVKRIQMMTRTFIVTPPRDKVKEPCFEVKGTPENVERARKEIESYIMLRTGSKYEDEDPLDFSGADGLAERMQHKYQLSDVTSEVPHYSGGGSGSFTGDSGVDVASPTLSTVYSGMFTPPDTSYQPMSAPLLSADKVFDFGPGKPQPLSPTGSYESNSSDGFATNSPKQSPLVTKATVACWSCKSREDSMAALMPCGHDMFCQACAHFIACSSGTCPLCNTQVTNVMHM